MEYNSDQHSIQCPKCGHGMEEITYGSDLAIDRCTNCQGIWFDSGEKERLKDKWMGEALDIGDAQEGKKWDTVEDISCPRCGKEMKKGSDPDQPHIWFEYCDDHGSFMDAGEFTDFANETPADWFRRLFKGNRP